MIKEINAMGDTCPIPVVKTKNAIKELGSAGGTVETLVDNEIAVQNLTKMANQKGYGVKSEKMGEARYKVTMQIGSGLAQPAGEPVPSGSGLAQPAGEPVPSGSSFAQFGPAITSQQKNDDISCQPDARRKNTVVVISSSCMGTGDDMLGSALMKSFIYALSQQDELPSTILFYNGGAKITAAMSPAIEDLKSLEAEGVEILTCGTCLNHYGLTDQLLVGSVTNMYVIVEKMTQASLIIKP